MSIETRPGLLVATPAARYATWLAAGLLWPALACGQTQTDTPEVSNTLAASQGATPATDQPDAPGIHFNDLLMPFKMPVALLTDTMEDLSDIFGKGYQLGMAMVASPEKPGQSSLSFKAKPVMSFQYGRLRITSSMGGLIERRGGGNNRTLGFSLALWDTERWSTGVSLRTDGGRDPDKDDPVLQYLSPVRPTLRGRASARYRITHEWSLGTGLSFDMLGRGGGTTGGLDLGYGVPIAPGWRASASAGLSAADPTYMRSYYGISEQVSAASGGQLARFRPHEGLQAASLGAALSWQLHPNWRLGVSGSASQLLDQAARSPVTLSSFSYSVAVGIVFQSRRHLDDND